MTKEQIIEEINDLIRSGNEVLKTKWNVENGYGFPTYVDNSIFQDWYTKIKFLAGQCLKKDNEFYRKIEDLSINTFSNTTALLKILNSILDYVNKGLLSLDFNSNSFNVIGAFYKVLERFNDVVKQLRKRYNNRSTLDVSDEYDVQDLLHCLLKLFYDDIRKEEWTPSYAGKCARQDFLLKKEKCVIEVKKTRQGLTEKELGDELLIDISRYKVHPDCSSLICFIFDPDSRISNPIGFIEDLEKSNEGFLKMIINPI